MNQPGPMYDDAEENFIGDEDPVGGSTNLGPS